MAHRIREAMTDPNPGAIGGEGKVIEADETYHGKSEKPVPARTAPVGPTPRGRARSESAPSLPWSSAAARLAPSTWNTSRQEHPRKAGQARRPQERLHTDESNLYPKVGTEFASP